MPFQMLSFNYTDSSYFISNKKDSTVGIIQDNHPSVKYMTAIMPPHRQILPGYNGIIYSLPRTHNPFRTGVMDRNTAYFIHIGSGPISNPPTTNNNPEQEEL
jgi:hypothetical protein